MPFLAIPRTVLLTPWICCGHRQKTVVTLRGGLAMIYMVSPLLMVYAVIVRV